MEYKFWKHAPLILIAIPVLYISSVIFLIVGSIYFNELWLMIVIGLFILILGFFLIFFDKKYLSKISYTEEGVAWTWLNRNIIFFKWDEITDVKATSYSWTSSYLTFVIGEQQINIDLTKKMYNTIMDICPNPNIKMMINNIYCFRGYHRKDYK